MHWKLIKKVLIRCLLPITLAYILKVVHTKSNGVDIPDALSAFLPYIEEFLKFAAYAGIASIVIEEVIEKTIFPEWKRLLSEEIVPPIKEELKEARLSFITVLQSKKLTFIPGDHTTEFLSELWQKNFTQESSLSNPELTEVSDPELTEVKELLSNGDFHTAISRLKNLAESPTRMEYLLTAYTNSLGPWNWAKAEEILGVYGKPSHYIRLALNNWENNNTLKAITLSEKAYELIKETPEDEQNPELVGACKNSLAYYYADALIQEKKATAREFADAEVTRRKTEHPDSPEYANALDTLGYVKISFNDTKNGILEGIDNVNTAIKLGAEEALSAHHLAKGYTRIAQL